MQSVAPNSSIQGFIKESGTSAPLNDMKIEVLDLDNRVRASATSDAEGFFSVQLSEQDRSSFVDDRRGTLVLVRATGSNALRAVKAVYLTQAYFKAPRPLAMTAASGPSTALTTYWVGGVVLDAEGDPVVGYRVEAVDDGVSSDTQLTLDPPITASDGTFIVEYTLTGTNQLPNNPNVALRVDIKDTTTSALYGSSVTRCTPGRHEIFAITSGTDGLNEDNFRGQPEFNAIEGAVDQAFGGGLAGLTDAEIEKVACRAGYEPQQVASLSWSTTMSANTSVSTEAYYAISRSGLPLSSSSLYALSASDLEDLLNDAIDRGVVSTSLSSSVSTIASSIANARGAAALEDPLNAGQDTLVKEIIDTASLGGTTVSQLVQDYYEHTGTVSQFWEGKRTSLGPAIVDRLQFSLQAGTVTGNHVPLVEHLQTLWGTSISGPRDLAKFTKTEWENFLTQNVGGSPVGVPADFSGSSTVYAETIFRMLEATMPTEAVAYRVQSAALTQDIAELVEVNPGFDFNTTNVENFWSSATAPSGGLNDTLKEELKTVQRLFKVAPTIKRVEAVEAFLDDGAKSGLDLYSQGKTAFLKKFSTALGGTEVAEQVFARVEKRSLGIVAAFSRLGPELGQQVLASVVIPKPGCEQVDLESIFGSLDSCLCRHCESITSPSAYLVDLLRWLREQPDTNSGGKKMLERLLELRPDIEEVELSCKNSDTPMPTIDLVVEELEREVYRTANGSLPGAPQYEWPQTTLPAEVLRAVPEHTFADAYTPLTAPTAVYPWTLPFQESLARCRVYLEHLGVKRPRLLELFERFPLTSSGFSAAQLETARRNEWIGIDAPTAALVAGPLDPGTQSWDKLWGVSGTVSATIGTIKIFLEQSRLSLTQLQTLVGLRVGSALSLTYGPGCDLATSTVDGLDEAGARTLQAFLRLRLATGWTLGQLDGAIATTGSVLADPLSGPAGNATVLARLADIHRLQDRFPRLGLGEVLAWLGDVEVVPWGPDERSGIPPFKRTRRYRKTPWVAS